jgi:hypothetical protein
MGFSLLKDGALVPIEKPKQRGVFAGGIRHVARTGARIAEAAVGIPGDLLSLGVHEIEKLSKKPASGKSILPTSQDLREKVTKKLTGKYLESESSHERLSDEIFQDAALFFTPGKVGKLPKYAKILKNLAVRMGAATAGNVASRGAENIGLGKTSQAIAKTGSMLLFGNIGGRTIKDHTRDLYKKVPGITGIVVKAPTLKRYISKETQTLERGLGSAPERAVLSRMKAVSEKFDGNKIRLDELIASKRSLNWDKAQVKKELQGDPRRRGAEISLDKLTGEINNEIRKFGEKVPAFGEPYRLAETTYGALKKSERIGSFIRKKNKNIFSSSLGVLAVTGGLFGKLGSMTSIGGGLLGSYKIAQALERIARSKELRKYYLGAVKAASMKNAAVMNRNLAKFDQVAEKEEKNKKSFRILTPEENNQAPKRSRNFQYKG